MELKFIDSKGKEEVLATSDNLSHLKDIVSNKYLGEEIITWQSGPSGKSYNERVPGFPCSCVFDDGSSYIIS